MGSCNWEAISTIRKALSIPVFANGGICSLDDVSRCVETTGVSGVMGGEAILENPAFFVNGVHPDGHLITVVCVEGGVINRTRSATSISIWRSSIVLFPARSKPTCSRSSIAHSLLARRERLTDRFLRTTGRSWR